MSTPNVDRLDYDANWDAAIKLAEADLQATMRRSRELRKAIRLLKKNREEGLEMPLIPKK